MTGYGRDELRYATPLVEAMIADAPFRQWCWTQTAFAAFALSATPEPDLQRRYRPRTRNPYWYNVWCGKDGRCECRVGDNRCLESDAFLIFTLSDDSRLAVHIEVKSPQDRLRPGQAETYARRADCWRRGDYRPRSIPEHQYALTLVLTPDASADDPRLAYFDKVLRYSEVARRVASFPV